MHMMVESALYTENIQISRPTPRERTYLSSSRNYDASMNGIMTHALVLSDPRDAIFYCVSNASEFKGTSQLLQPEMGDPEFDGATLSDH